MNFKEKLGFLRPIARAATSVEPEPHTSTGAFLPPSMTPHGPVRLSERIHAAGFRQGTIELAPARGVSGATLARLALDDTLASVDASRMLFVDTETTGLHGGAGTLPFLIGLAWFEDASLKVQQLFLGRPGEERPLLEMLAERLSQASLLVSFNGKCFDWPLLRTRLVMNRVKAPPVPPHLDLLHCSRRLFKRRLRGTRLQDLESHVLGFHREHDIDGALIPQVYFDWLRRGSSHMLERVLEHNVRDVVTMAALLTTLARRIETVDDDDSPEDCLAVAEVTLRSGDASRAEQLAMVALDRGANPLTAFDALCLGARLASKRRDWATAAHRYSRALELPDVEQAARDEVHLALARVLEHKLKDRARALIHARLGAAAEPPSAHSRRLSRLESFEPSLW